MKVYLYGVEDSSTFLLEGEERKIARQKCKRSEF